MEGLQHPIEAAVGALLRRAVLDHAAGERRRRHPAYLHVGTPGHRVARLLLGPGGHRARPLDEFDAGVCVDVVAAMRARVRAVPYVANLPELRMPVTAPEPALVWLTRAGDLADTQDVDLRWLAAARTAWAEAGVPLRFVVVNRRGWRDPRSGAGRTWVRLRPSVADPPT